MLTLQATMISVAQQAADPLTIATGLVRSGRYDAALAELQKALQSHPDDPKLLTVQGMAYSLKGDDPDALHALQKALRRAPNFGAALRAEAEILARRRDPGAIAVLRQILQADPQESTAREMLAAAEAQGGDCSAAIADFQQVGPPLEKHPESLQSQAGCLFKMKHYPEAASVLDQLRTLQDSKPDILYDLALTHMLAGDNKAAAAAITPLLQHAADPEILLLAADIFENQGDTPRSAELLHQAILADPNRPEPYVRFAELCMSHESYQAGVDMVTAGISRLPQDAALFLARGLLYGGMANYDKAEADFRSAELYDPHHGTAAYAVGLIQTQRNNPNQALATVRSALRGHPEDAQLHYLLARILIDDGAQPNSPEFVEATSSAEAAVRLNAQLVLAHDMLARIYMATGQHALAVNQCRAALALDPSDQNALYRLMRSLRESGDIAGAHDAAKQVADLHERARQEETTRLRYRIEDASTPHSEDKTTTVPAQP